jgi:hypothetical protein
MSLVDQLEAQGYEWIGEKQPAMAE